jgi:hypothetical protein
MPPPHILSGEVPGFQRRVKRYELDMADVRRRIDGSLEATVGSDSLQQWVDARLDAFIATPREVFIQVPDARMRSFRELRRDVLAAASQLLPATSNEHEIESIREMLGSAIDRLLESPPFAEILGALPSADRPAVPPLALTTEGART